MNRFRSTKLMLVSAVIVGMLSACGESNGNNTSSSSSGNGQATGDTPVSFTVSKSTSGYPYIEGQSNINEDKYMKKLEELTNVDLKVELIPHSEFEQKLQLMFASGDLPDLIETKGINSSSISAAVDAGVIIPLNDLINQYAPNMKKALSEQEWKYGTISKDGVIYGIPTLESAPHGVNAFIRKDWLDKLGLEVPSTLDEYVEVFKAFRDQDPNGNGKKDEIPFSGRENFKSSDIFFGAYGVSPESWTYSDGELVPNFILPNMKEALAFYKMLYDEKLFDNESFVQQGKDWDSKIRGQGVVGFFQHSSTEAQLWDTEVKSNNPGASVIPIAAPVGPDGFSGGTVRSTISNNTWVITKNAKNPEAIVKFLDFFFSEEGLEFSTYGIEGETYTKVDGKHDYKYPETSSEIEEEMARQDWYRFTGPSYLNNEEYMTNKPDNELIVAGLEIAKQEGNVNAGAGMPVMETLKSRPELEYKGLWMEFAAKVIAGKENVDSFDSFVADWKKRGGADLIKEATEWYNTTH